MATTATPTADAIRDRLAPAIDTLGTIEKNLRRARRAAAHGRYATEDAVAGAARGIRRRPIRTAALAAGAGAIAGCLFGFVMSRRGCADDDRRTPWEE